MTSGQADAWRLHIDLVSKCPPKIMHIYFHLTDSSDDFNDFFQHSHVWWILWKLFGYWSLSVSTQFFIKISNRKLPRKEWPRQPISTWLCISDISDSIVKCLLHMASFLWLILVVSIFLCIEDEKCENKTSLTRHFIKWLVHLPPAKWNAPTHPCKLYPNWRLSCN
jgi:hypothetical protein